MLCSISFWWSSYLCWRRSRVCWRLSTAARLREQWSHSYWVSFATSGVNLTRKAGGKDGPTPSSRYNIHNTVINAGDTRSRYLYKKLARVSVNLLQVFSCASFFHAIEHSSVSRQKLSRMWLNPCNVIGRPVVSDTAAKAAAASTLLSAILLVLMRETVTKYKNLRPIFSCLFFCTWRLAQVSGTSFLSS